MPSGKARLKRGPPTNLEASANKRAETRPNKLAQDPQCGQKQDPQGVGLRATILLHFERLLASTWSTSPNDSELILPLGLHGMIYSTSFC
jgi:hypothetical protein